MLHFLAFDKSDVKSIEVFGRLANKSGNTSCMQIQHVLTNSMHANIVYDSK